MSEYAIEKVTQQPLVQEADFIDPSTDADGALAALIAAYGSPDDEDLLTYNLGSNRVEWLSRVTLAGTGMVPTFIDVGESFTIPEFRQVVYAIDIVNNGDLIVNGDLIMVG